VSLVFKQSDVTLYTISGLRLGQSVWPNDIRYWREISVLGPYWREKRTLFLTCCDGFVGEISEVFLGARQLCMKITV